MKINVKNSEFNYQSSFTNKKITISQAELTSSPWIFLDKASEKIIRKLYCDKKLNNIAIISEGIVTGLNKLYLKSKEEISLMKFENKYFFPCYRGKEVDKYYLKPILEFVFYPYKLVSNKTIPIDEKIIIQECPNYMNYLRKNMQLIRKRKYFINSSKKWYELWNQRSLLYFNTSKIITPELSDKNRFALSSKSTFYGDTVCGIKIKDKYINKIKLKYILAILNSKLIEWFYKKTTVPKAGGFYIYKVMYLNNIPIKEVPLNVQKNYIDIVDKIISINKSTDYPKHIDKQLKVKEYEKQIDRMVYKLYNLNEEEIEIVEKNLND
jgi:hypothetical protein